MNAEGLILAEQVKTMAKDAVDVGQDARIADLARRVTALEESKGWRK